MLTNIDTLVNAAIQGELVCFPTDTVPALAVRPDRADLIYALKQRPETKPLILMGAEAGALLPYVGDLEDGAGDRHKRPGREGDEREQYGQEQDRQEQDGRKSWQLLMDRYWPGALTLVLPSNDRVPQALRAPDYLGIRVPGLAIARQILARTGPLATTSVNRSGQPALVDVLTIEATFPELAILDPTNSDPWPMGTEPSTVIQWRPEGWYILRQGLIRPDLNPPA